MQPNSTEDCVALSPDAARVVFNAARLAAPGDRPLAVVDANGRAVCATTAAAEAFGLKSPADLQRLLLTSDGPSARRLRRLAATLTVGGPARLERLRFDVGRRTTSVNLHCARIAVPDGATFLVLSIPAAASGGESLDAPVAPQSDQAAAAGETRAFLNFRFLWSLDRDERFGVSDPSLIAILGADAPRLGESLADLRLRVEIENADGLARAIGTRETFCDLPVVCRRTQGDRGLRIALSAAPTFDARRDFAGYRGFGIVVEVGRCIWRAQRGRSRPPLG